MADQTSTSTEPFPSESTPLLQPVGNGDTPVVEAATPVSPRERTLAVIIGTWVQLLTSILCFSLAIAAGIILNSAPAEFSFPYAVDQLISPVLILSVIAAFFAGYNLVSLRRTNKTLPSLLNIVVDIILLLPLGPLSDWNRVSFECERWRRPPGYPTPPEDLTECWRFARTVAPVLWAFGVCTLLFCLSSLFLLLAEIIRMARSRSAVGRGNSSARWQMPVRTLPWQITFEFTIKFVAPDSGQTRAGAVETVAAAVDAPRQTAGEDVEGEA